MDSTQTDRIVGGCLYFSEDLRIILGIDAENISILTDLFGLLPMRIGKDKCYEGGDIIESLRKRAKDERVESEYRQATLEELRHAKKEKKKSNGT